MSTTDSPQITESSEIHLEDEAFDHLLDLRQDESQFENVAWSHPIIFDSNLSKIDLNTSE